MNKFLSILGLGFMAQCVSPLPSFAMPDGSGAPTLPINVRAVLPKGATSFLLKSFPIGPKAAQRLVHIWAMTRPNGPTGLNRYDRYAASPFCVDIFAPNQNAKKKSGWRLISSAAYIDANAPNQIKTHWLLPASHQGPILEIISGNGAPGVSTRHTLLTWDKGFDETYTAPVPQIFASGGSGGGSISQRFETVDAKGYLVVSEVNASAGKLQSTTRYVWDGARFSAAK